MSYTHLSLFSGIGGLDLAAEQAGFKTVGQCEFADYPTKVLEKHWPEVARWRDIRDLTGEDFYARTGLRTVDVISGGFPCQPFSVAGKQKGKNDDRYLWPEMLRVIRELAPRCVVGENVPGIIRIAAGQVVKDLEQAGYHVVVFNFEAAAVGALHRRERVAFVAYDGGIRQRGTRGICDVRSIQNRPTGQRETAIVEQSGGVSSTVAYATELRMEGRSCESVSGRTKLPPSALRGSGGYTFWSNWETEPDVGRVANGVPNRVDRLKCLGNAVVPQQFYPIFLALMQELKREDAV